MALSFSKYYRKIYDETMKSTLEIIPNINDILKINITDEFYDRMADITMNLYVQLSRKIASSQMSSVCFGKSTRIQFKQVYDALNDCIPRSVVLTKTQRATIHYIILSEKNMKESIRMICNIEDTKKDLPPVVV